MLARIKFAKFGALKFIGHLDVLRFFQKAVRRSGIDIVYTMGFHPHQIMSFALPLGVGITSDGEYLDVELNKCSDPQHMLDLFNSVMTPGIEILEFCILPEPTPEKKKAAAMSLVSAADYYIAWRDQAELPFASFSLFQQKFKKFMEQETILVCKKSKKTETEIDLKSAILCWDFSTKNGVFKDDGVAHAEHFENGWGLFLKLTAGSVLNVKPELVIEAFCTYAGIPFQWSNYQLHRMKLYLEGGIDNTLKN